MAGSGSIHYKFKSARSFETVFFEGHEISPSELKALICEKQKLGPDAVAELMLKNPRTQEEYDDSRGIPRNASVLVVRQPAQQYPALQAQAAQLAAAATAAAAVSAKVPQPSPLEAADDFGGDVFSEQAVAPALPDEDTNDLQDYIHGQQQSWEQGLTTGGRGRGRGRGPGAPFASGGSIRPPMERTCPRCKQSGHWERECPTYGDPTFDVKRTHLPRGVPGNMLQQSAAGSIIMPNGQIGQLRPNEAGFNQEMAALTGAAVSRPTASTPALIGARTPPAAAPLSALVANGDTPEQLMLTEEPHQPVASPSSAAMQLALTAEPQMVGVDLMRVAPAPIVPSGLTPSAALGDGALEPLGGPLDPFPPPTVPLQDFLFSDKPLSPAAFMAMQAKLAAAAAPAKVRPRSRSPKRRRRRSRSRSRSQSPKRSHRVSRNISRRSDRNRSYTRSRSPERRFDRERSYPSRGALADEPSRRSNAAPPQHQRQRPPPTWGFGEGPPPRGSRSFHPSTGQPVNKFSSGGSAPGYNPYGQAGAQEEAPHFRGSPQASAQLSPHSRQRDEEQGATQRPPSQQMQQLSPLGRQQQQRHPAEARGRDRWSDASTEPATKNIASKARADDRWEEYSTVVAPPRPAVAALLASEEPQRAHSKEGRHSRDNGHVLPDEGFGARPEEGAHDKSATQDGSRGHADAVIEKRKKLSPSPSAASQPHQQKMGLSSIALDSVIHRDQADRDGQQPNMTDSAPQTVQPVESGLASKEMHLSVEADEKKKKKKRSKEEKHKKHKKRDRSERDAGPASDAEQPPLAQSQPSPKRERASRPDDSPKPEPALQRDAAAGRMPATGQRLRSGSPIPRRPERLPAISRLGAAAEKPKPAPRVTGKGGDSGGGFFLKQNPTLYSEGRTSVSGAARSAAAMREAVQLDEDALATGSAPRRAVAELAQNQRAAPSLLGRAAADAVHPQQIPAKRPITERLQRLDESPRELLESEVKSSRKGRSGAEAQFKSSAVGDNSEHSKKHKKRRHG